MKTLAQSLKWLKENNYIVKTARIKLGDDAYKTNYTVIDKSGATEVFTEYELCKFAHFAILSEDY